MSKLQLQLKLVDNPKSTDYQILIDGIHQHSTKSKGFIEHNDHGAVFAYDGNKIIGGVGFYTNIGSLEIEKLWIEKRYRQEGLGSLLLRKVENEGKARNCRFATLATGDWEALDFYLKNGYSIEFKRSGYDNDSTYYYLIKHF